jgi:tRNA modification GTPase
VIEKLVESFEQGNVIKNGVPVVIAGRPNAGKSTLLNKLLEHDRAIVTEIPGTTRDLIEDQMVIEGILFRFIDTAGLRETNDVVEKIGVSKTLDAISKAAVVICLFDVTEVTEEEVLQDIQDFKARVGIGHVLVVGNKAELVSPQELKKKFPSLKNAIYISAKQQQNIGTLQDRLLKTVDTSAIQNADVVVTNARHAASLKLAGERLEKVQQALKNHLPGDLLALDIRQVLNELGAITGEVNNEHLLENIFHQVLYREVKS